jgi:hypothetical protein
MKTKILIICAITTLISWHIFLPAAFADTIKEEVSVIPGETITAADESAISSAATKVLRHIAQARGDLKDNKLDQAKGELNKAATLIDIIKAGVPTWKVKDHIWVAKKHLSYEDTTTVLQDFVPIYASLDDIEALVPVEKTKAHIKQAEKKLKEGSKKKGREELELADEALVYTEIDVPVQFTEEHVNAALDYLGKNDSKKADEALAAAEDGVQFMSILVNEPLAGAKKSLYQATKDFEAGEYSAAKRSLKEAESYLKKAAKSTDTKTREEAKKLEKQAADLANKVEKGGEATRSYITALWHKVQALSERSVEQMATGWQKLRVKSKAKDELINAKLHIAYARIDQMTLSDAAKATAEIGKAKSYLKQAMPKVGDATKRKLAGIDTALKEAETKSKEKGEGVLLRFAKIEAQLKDIIKNM